MYVPPGLAGRRVRHHAGSHQPRRRARAWFPVASSPTRMTATGSHSRTSRSESDWDTVWVTYAKGNTTAGQRLGASRQPRQLRRWSRSICRPRRAGAARPRVEEALSSVTRHARRVHPLQWRPGCRQTSSSVRFGKPVPPSGHQPAHQWRLRGGYRRLEQLGQWHAERQQRCKPAAARRACSRPARTGTGGFAAYSLTSLVQRNTTYPVSAWLLHTGARPAPRDAWRPRWNARRRRCLPATTPIRGCRTMARSHRTPGRNSRAISSFRTATSSTWLSTSRARPPGSTCTWMTCAWCRRTTTWSTTVASRQASPAGSHGTVRR